MADNISVPGDLQITPQPNIDKDFFNFKATGLKINKKYQIKFQWVYDDGEVSPWSPGYEFTTINYQSNLVAPTITVTPAALGYIVSYTKQTDPNFAYAGVEEVVSSATTAPTTGWVERDVSSSNPIQVTTGVADIANRWVRVRLYDKVAGWTGYSNAVSVKPFDPVDDAEDKVPPNEVTITSAAWVGDEIQIAYTIPADGGVEFRILLTNGTKTRFIFEYPIGSGTSQIARISETTLESIFGTEYPTSFTGLFKSLDKPKNESAGTPFTITEKANDLLGVVPVVSGTPLINGFSLSWDLGTAKIAKVYTSTTDGFTPNESQPPQYYGAGPYIENTTFTSGFAPVYYRVKFFGKTESRVSSFSAQGSVIPINPDTTDTNPPPAVTSLTGVGASNPDDPSGLSGQITLTLVQPTMPVDFAGYSVKIINGSQTWYQEFPSPSALSTIVVKNGIYVGQQYSISVATRDKTNIQSYVSASNNPISVNDTRVNTSAVTNLTVSATDSIATASWTAPVDNKVGSYRVMITSNADTAFASPLQTIFTDSTQTSFGGLTAATAYRIRITTKYSNNGALSTQNTDTTFTLDSSGAISDGQAPTTNPALTSSMVKSLFGAFAITFPSVSNSDAVTYEVFIKPTNSTGIVSETYKVLEVAGTFAVVRTLADRTTTLSYGTDYYIAIRAKDNDGISTGTVTAVGPVQTLQVQNADLGANSVYANNIQAGEIDASKMVTDLLFAEKTINVGESTSLNRIRLDANTIAAGTTGYSNPTDPIKSRLFIGAGKYDDAGTPVYADNLGRFSLKDKLKFDGTNLQIDANGSFGGLLTAGPTGQEVKIGLAAGGGTNHGIYLAATGDYLYNSGNFRLGSGKITYNGTLLNIDSQVNITGSSTVQGDLGITSAGATLYAGASKSTGNRVVMNSGGLFGYSGATINFSFPNSTGQFALGTGEISGWSVNSGNIEKSTTAGATTTYAGLSTGTYAFYAGGGSAGSGSPKFKVTQAGVMTASGVVIKDGQLDIGADWPTGGFHVDSFGALKASGATVKGVIEINGGSTFNGNVEILSGGTLYMGSSNANTSRVVLTSAGLNGYNGSTPIFSLTTSGTGTIGGWSFDSTKLSSSGMILNSSDQTITFKNGFIIDNDTINVVAINASNQAGGVVAGTDSNDSVGSDTNESNVSSLGTSSSSPSSSTFSIRLPGQALTNAPRIAMASSSTNGSSLLLENKSSAGTSSIQLSSGGLYINLGKVGGLFLEGFTNKYHYTYNYNIQPAALQIRPDGTVTSGRSIFRSGASETGIVTNNTHSHVGLIGDIILSTAD